MKKQTYTVTDIEWDRDDSPEAAHLPATVTVTVTAEPGNEADEIAEALSDLTGFCVHGFTATAAA